MHKKSRPGCLAVGNQAAREHAMANWASQPRREPDTPPPIPVAMPLPVIMSTIFFTSGQNEDKTTNPKHVEVLANTEK
jgi:hypothetical protein